MPVIQLNQQVKDMLDVKVREYKVTNGHNRGRELVKNLSRQKMIDYAIQLLEWMDTHLGDPRVDSILTEFEYKTKVRPVGRPSDLANTVSKLGSMVMQECVNRARAAGLDPQDDQVIYEIYSNLKMIHGGRIKPNKLLNAKKNKQRMEELRKDSSIVTLQDETNRIKKGLAPDGTKMKNDWS